MILDNDFLQKIRPNSNDENGKHNRKLYNLFKGISKRKNNNLEQIKIWFNAKSRWDGSHIEFHKNIHKEQNILRQVMIDPDGQMISGYFLMDALRKNKPTRFSLCTFLPNHMIDVTDWFLNTYIRIGRCMFDSEHYDFNNQYNNRYYIINKNNRKCRWCGEHFNRNIIKTVKIDKYECWKSSIRM
ncbi:hypothetical protein [Paenibacillus oleatilyticus]|uniref:hypothetical protein n=1 Tax=Paenibacillus oleatilyticus TaxID=2594886 RepID=UPI001C1FAB10|nr:hypothetical protein [Paenibacillus oleatilyticus]MBU7315989.1 hypothetical protein [Paenibacillus oleatilyticus]